MAPNSGEDASRASKEEPALAGAPEQLAPRMQLGWGATCLCMLVGALVCLAEGAELQAVVHRRWIIVTTINYPTESIRILASMTDWKVLVVADRKTPTDWHLDGVDFLGVDEQLSLGYQLKNNIGYNTYARKNMGYLRAIQLGAEEIYETDDDNEIVSGQLPNLDRGYYVYNGSGRTVVNPYAYFGYPSIWPRGYPLDQIRPEMSAEPFSRVGAKPQILQGLADKDPDVDAIFRLTQPMGINFDKLSPAVVLPEGLMCPFNSQNTLFSKDALWALLIPVTTSFRVCDIWRGYWAQRLLWEIEGNLAFTAPTVNQFRNPHTLMKDFIDEDDLYKRAGELVQFLIAWKPSVGADLPTMMVELAKAMYVAKFWEEGDVGLMRAWVADLQAVGYTFPSVRVKPQPPALQPVNWQMPTPEHWNRYTDVVLVIMFNVAFPGWLEVQKQLRAAYTPLFRQIVYTGFHHQEGFPEEDTWVSCDGGHHGFYMYQCFSNVLQEVKAPASGGYLIIGDDVLLSHCMVKNFNKSMVWFQQDIVPLQIDFMEEAIIKEGQGKMFWVWNVRALEYLNHYLSQVMSVGNRLGKKLRKKLKGDPRKWTFGGVMADAFYVPAKGRMTFAMGAAAFEDSGLSHEAVVPNLLGMITDDTGRVDRFAAEYMTEPGEREYESQHMEEYLTPSGIKNLAFMLHPLKMSNKNTSAHFWQWYAQKYSC